DLAWQFNPSALAKSKAPDVFVKFLIADAESKFRCPDVARFDQNVAHAQIAKRAMIVQSGASIVPEAVLAKNLRIRTQLVFIENRGSGDDLEGRTWLLHVDDGPVFHLFGLRLGAWFYIKFRGVGEGQDFACLRPHQNDRGLLWRVPLHRRVDFVFDN